MFLTKYHKYNNVKQTYKNYSYDSKLEANYAFELDCRVNAGEIVSWERQVKVSFDMNGKHICDYKVDFKLLHPDGLIEFVEVKGFETDVWRLKWKMMEAVYGSDARYKLTIVR